MTSYDITWYQHINCDGLEVMILLVRSFSIIGHLCGATTFQASCQTETVYFLLAVLFISNNFCLPTVIILHFSQRIVCNLEEKLSRFTCIKMPGIGIYPSLKMSELRCLSWCLFDISLKYFESCLSALLIRYHNSHRSDEQWYLDKGGRFRREEGTCYVNRTGGMPSP